MIRELLGSCLPIARLRQLMYRARRRLALVRRSPQPVPVEVLFTSSNRADQGAWEFHDEDWVRIRNRFEDRRRLRAGDSFSVCDQIQEPSGEICFLEDGSIAFDGMARTNDEWLFVCLDPLAHGWTDFTWTLEFKKKSPFRELQFDFRYRDLFHRYRYRFEDDFLYFDILEGGRSFQALSRVYLPVELDRWYRLCIDVIGFEFRCSVDGRLVSIDYDFRCSFPSGSVAVILWEDDGQTAIEAELRNLVVRRLARSSS